MIAIGMKKRMRSGNRMVIGRSGRLSGGEREREVGFTLFED